MRRLGKLLAGLLTVAVVPLASAGCAAARTVEGQGLRQTAAAEATAILERAEATAIVLRAQAGATALVASAAATAAPAAVPSPSPSAMSTVAPAAPAGAPLAPPSAEPTTVPPTTVPAAGGVEVLGVGLAADGGFVMVSFLAPPQLARGWQQGMLYLVDEANGVAYKEIPVMPVIGPLLARPKEAGQRGYVMFVNAAPGIVPGARVTVVLGSYRQEHVMVE